MPEATARERSRHSCCHLAHTSLFAGARLQLSFRPRTHLCNSSSRWKESAMRAAALPGPNGASTGDAPSSPGACDDPDLVSARGSTPARTAWHRFPLGAAASPEWPAMLRRKNKSGASRSPEDLAASATRRAADCAVVLRRRGTCCRRQACSLRRRFRVTSRRPACNFCNSSSSACIAPATRNRSTLHARTRPDQAAPLARLLNSDCSGGNTQESGPMDQHV